MAPAPMLPAGAVFEIDAIALPEPVKIRLRLEALDAAPRLRGQHQARVLEPGAPEHGLPAGRVVLLQVRQGSPRAAARGRRAALVQGWARQAARRAPGTAGSVAEPLATFHDPERSLFGTLAEWVPGRYWRMEVDDRLFDRPRPSDRPDLDDSTLFRTDYAAKRLFMARFAYLLRELGADRLARRYAWGTGVSQRRVIKRDGHDADPHGGWTAVVFDDDRLAAPPRPADPEAARWLNEWSALGVHPAGRFDWRPAARAATAAPSNDAGERGLFAYRMLYRADLRRAHLLRETEDGLAQRMLTEAEAVRIRRQAQDPLVETYLKCLAVHVCMLPATNLVVLGGAWWYAATRGLTLAEGARVAALGWAIFAVAPMSPGSLLRGLFVLFVAVKRRSFKGLRLALALSFWRGVGYMAFPLQMISTFPALARFLAARWAIRAVRLIPVYGRRGALLEHRVFDLTFNLPLTLARLWKSRR